jgi:hypothetical protein
MSTPVWCEFSCDECSRVSPGRWASGDYVPRIELKQDAERAGWIFDKGQSYCSAVCAQRALGQSTQKGDVR